MQTDRSIYLSLSELRRRHRAERAEVRKGTLTEFELSCFSQHGEDGVIAEILARTGSGGNFFVEFGIEDGREGNCVFLADVLGWSGLFLEADRADYDGLAGKYAADEHVMTMNVAVTPENVEDLFATAGVPSEPDVLSIDVDGADYWIWDALNRYRPRLVVIEYNALLPQGRQLVQPRDQEEAWLGTDYFGASLDALCALGQRKGYQIVHTELAGGNSFFVRNDLVADRFPSSDQVPRRHRPNYFLTGYRHPADDRRRSYVDLASGEEYWPDSMMAAGESADEQAQTDPPSEPTSPPGAYRRFLPADEAQALASRTDFAWHQRFEIAPGVFTPGVNDVEFLLDTARVPKRLDGATVLDIGTTNGGAAFECERRGASRVVAVDIADDNWFGFASIKEILGSRAEHIQANIYELPALLTEIFDVVFFWGVLYHLRHPLLALDNVRRLAREHVSIESAVADHELGPESRGRSLIRFYRRDELGGDSSNWFAPTAVALADWCRSSGLEPAHVESWPSHAPTRAMVVAKPVEPEYLDLSYERPLTCSVEGHGAHFGTLP